MMARPIIGMSDRTSREARLVVRCDIRAFVAPERGHQVKAGRVVNISTGGIYVACHDPVLSGLMVSIEMETPLLGDESLGLNGWVAHVSPDGMGIQFDTSDLNANARVLRLMGKLRAQQVGGQGRS